MSLNSRLNNFVTEHRLPASYINTVQQWFLPLAEQIKAHCLDHKYLLGKPLTIAINGSQGSGKSTLANLLVLLTQEFNLSTIALSIDDFYLSKAARQQLSHNNHPLLETRGVPGTHNIDLAKATISQLQQGQIGVYLPRFSKAIDDVLPQNLWQSTTVPVDIIIVEGWCMGATAQNDIDLTLPVNELEREQDSNGNWRRYVNQQLKNDYREFFSLFDRWIMLKAPSFNVVYQWRLEQEQKLAAASDEHQSGIMSADQILNFIQYYQRITEHCLQTLPNKVHDLFSLNDARNITEHRGKL